MSITYAITGDVDFGPFQSKQPEFKEEVVSLGGARARICTYRLSDSDADRYGGRERRYVVEMYLTEPRDRSRPVFLATCKTPAGQYMAGRIFRSVKPE